MRLEDVQGRVTLKVGGRSLMITGVEGTGEPEKVRTAPREPGRVVLPGTIQSALGDKEWDPDGESTLMTRLGEGRFGYAVELNKGHYEFKVARNGSWAENWGAGFAPGGGNLSLEVPADRTVVYVEVDFNGKSIRTSLTSPGLKLDLPIKRKATLSPETRYSSFAVTTDALLGLEQGTLQLNGAAYDLTPRGVLDEDEYQPEQGNRFDLVAMGARQYALGESYGPPGTVFFTWTPLADATTLVLNENGKEIRYAMAKQPRGIWAKTVPGNHSNARYRYEYTWRGKTRTAVDIWCKSATPDGEWSIVPDLSKTSPAGWDADKGPATQQSDAIIYEVHVRDFTVLPSSGVKPEWRGTYMGMIQPGTTTPDGQTVTGLDHLKRLGITHVHLLPTQSFLNRPDEYTWGYATHLFNVPEETYATKGATPNEVIGQYKQMVQGFHRAGIGVVMDVVYNHTWPPEGEKSPFEQTVPHYFFREDDFGRKKNESGVGNALADERTMARHYVRDSLTYWLREYHVDGFRFDLLGMAYPASVKELAAACREVRPDVILYGEPWTGGGPTHFGKGAQKGTGVGVFNDDFRNAIRGELDGPGQGYVMGNSGLKTSFELGLAGSPSFTSSPRETVNYFSAHDNMTWWDKVDLSMPGASQEAKFSVTKEAYRAILFAKGVAFLEGGVEIGRTKGGDQNSYAAGDKVNGFDWNRAALFTPITQFVSESCLVRRKELARPH
jgi:pullulanase